MRFNGKLFPFLFSVASRKEDADEDEEEEYFYPQPSKLASREFFNLLQTCLKGHEDQRDVLLSSLHKQLQHFVRSTQDVSDVKIKDEFSLYSESRSKTNFRCIRRKFRRQARRKVQTRSIKPNVHVSDHFPWIFSLENRLISTTSRIRKPNWRLSMHWTSVYRSSAPYLMASIEICP